MPKLRRSNFIPDRDRSLAIFRIDRTFQGISRLNVNDHLSSISPFNVAHLETTKTLHGHVRRNSNRQQNPRFRGLVAHQVTLLTLATLDSDAHRSFPFSWNGRLTIDRFKSGQYLNHQLKSPQHQMRVLCGSRLQQDFRAVNAEHKTRLEHDKLLDVGRAKQLMK